MSPQNTNETLIQLNKLKENQQDSLLSPLGIIASRQLSQTDARITNNLSELQQNSAQKHPQVHPCEGGTSVHLDIWALDLELDSRSRGQQKIN